MYIDKISYQKTFNLGSFQSERIGVEISLNEGEDAKEALNTAKNLVHEYYMEGLPKEPIQIEQVADNKPVPIVQVEKPSKEDQQKQYLLDCKDITELKTFEKLVKSNPHLMETYDEQLKKLSV